MNYTMTFELTDEEIKDILTTAIEGGIGYWACLNNDTPEWKAASKTCRERLKDDPCYCDTALELLKTGKKIEFFDTEEYYEKADKWYLTQENFLNGCKLYEQNRGSLKKNLENGDFDADEADCLIQYALFNEVVFG